MVQLIRLSLKGRLHFFFHFSFKDKRQGQKLTENFYQKDIEVTRIL